MNSILSFLKQIWRVKNLRRKFLITLLILALYRVLAHIPAPGIDTTSLKSVFGTSAFLSLLDVFSGGTLANFSVMALNLAPYINASIILQMLTFVVPSLEELSKEGEYGRQKIDYYTRLLTVPLSIVQAVGLVFFLRNRGLTIVDGWLPIVTLVLTLTAGTQLLVWLGELITQYGISNGVSFLIFAGIAGRLPVSLLQTASVTSTSNVTNMVVFLTMTLVVIYLVVRIGEAVRQVTVQYARRSRGSETAGSQLTHLPLRLNQTGVIPIIFAVSLMLVPSFLGGILASSTQVQLEQLGRYLQANFVPTSALYSITYFLLVVGFTFLYTNIVFNPDKIADQIKKQGGFIPGIRPGGATAGYLKHILYRITLVGAVFLGLVAILPNLIQSMTGISTLAIGGTGILIVVSVVLETARDLQSQLVMHNYDKFLS